MALSLTKFSLIFFLVSLSLLTNAKTQPPTKFIKTMPATKTTLLKPKISHLHFYFHDTVSGSNPSAIPVTQPVNNSTFFGQISVIDDPLTVGPDPKSEQVGSAQGVYVFSDQTQISLFEGFNLYFTQGKYNGSVLTVLGRNEYLNPIRELSIVAGTGKFRGANGYALIRNYWFEGPDFIVEYNVTILHY